MQEKMPHSIDGEKSVLGSMLLDHKSIDIVFGENIQEDDFYFRPNRLIFQAIQTLWNRNELVDMTSISSFLMQSENLLNVGGSEYLIDLLNGAISSANIKHYIRIIKEKSQLRKLLRTIQTIQESCFNPQFSLQEILQKSEKDFLEITRYSNESNFRSSKEVVEQILEELAKLRDSSKKVTGVATGFNYLDKATNGLQPGDLIILAARPSMGKTAFALNLALNSAQNHKEGAVAIFSLEMPAEALMRRILSCKSKVNSYKFKTAQMDKSEINSVYYAANKLKELSIYIDDSAIMKMPEIYAKCRKLNEDMPLKLIVIDYLQLISSNSNRGENRQQEVSMISRELKGLAREFKVPVIALSQLSRGVESRQDKRPMLSDLRESGAIEQDADIVMFLYRDDYYNHNTENGDNAENANSEVEISIAKHRNGATGNFKLSFKKEISAFYDYEG